MITIMAICGRRDHDWVAVGHVRETAEENYTAAASFFPKPLYRVVVKPKYLPIRDVIMDLATRRLPPAIQSIEMQSVES